MSQPEPMRFPLIFSEKQWIRIKNKVTWNINAQLSVEFTSIDGNSKTVRTDAFAILSLENGAELVLEYHRPIGMLGNQMTLVIDIRNFDRTGLHVSVSKHPIIM